MKLYYSPGACSLSPHIVFREAGLPVTLVKASTKTHQLDDGTDYYTINPKGYVPLLELDNGERLSEGPAIVQYLADQNPASGLAPAAGTIASLSPAGMAQLHHLRNPQAVRSDVCAEHTGRIQGNPEGQARPALRLAVGRTQGQGLPHGQAVHGGRRVPVHRPALVRLRRHRSGQVAGTRGIRSASRRAAESPGSARRRRPGQATAAKAA